MLGNVFISYSRTDRAYIDKLATFLTEAGLTPWYDFRVLPGEQFDDVIQHAIDASSAVLVVLTPASVDSRWVAREIAYADDQDKPIFPLLLEPCSTPIRLASRQQDIVIGGILPSPLLVERLLNISGVKLPPRDAMPPQLPAQTTVQPIRESSRKPGTISLQNTVRFRLAGPPAALAFDKLGTSVVVASGPAWGRTAVCQAVNVATGAELTRVDLDFSGGAMMVEISPDGSTIAATGLMERRVSTPFQRELRVIDLEGRVLRSFDGLSVSDIAFCQTPGLIAVATGTGSTNIFDRRSMSTGIYLVDLTSGGDARADTHGEAVLACSLDGSGSWLAAGCVDGTCRMFDTRDGREVARHSGEGTMNSVAISDDGRLVGVAEDGFVYVLDAATGRRLAERRPMANRPWRHRRTSVKTIMFSPDARHLVVATGRPRRQEEWHRYLVNVADAATVMDIRLSRTIARWVFAEAAYGRPGGGAAFSPDGRLVVTVGRAGLQIIDIRTCEAIGRLSGSEKQRIFSGHVCLNSDGSVVACVSNGTGRGADWTLDVFRIGKA